MQQFTSSRIELVVRNRGRLIRFILIVQGVSFSGALAVVQDLDFFVGSGARARVDLGEIVSGLPFDHVHFCFPAGV